MTAAEAKFQRAVRDLGCICCRIEGMGRSPASIHHILSDGKRRKGEMYVLPLCPMHHNLGRYDARCVSRHPWKTRFVRRYGSEESLLAKVKDLIRKR